jgi:hypothetical protein
MFLDESGDHKLTRINWNYPIFVLGGVIVDRAYVRDVIEPAMRRFKQRHFGRDDAILHTVDMTNGIGDYAFLADPIARSSFYADLNAMLAEWDYKVVSSVVKKPELVAQYGANAEDPYMYSLHVLIEQFCDELGEEMDAGFVCAEKRGSSLDYDLMQAWERIRTRGTTNVSADQIDCRIVGLDLRDKRANLAGMQLAGLAVTPIGRHVLGTTPKPNRVQWTTIENKLRRVGTSYGGHGLVIRP